MQTAIRRSSDAIRILLAALGRVSFAALAGAAPRAADLVVTGARIYTAPGPALAEALAAKHDSPVYVGDANGAAAFVGPRTVVRHAHGHLVIPGLVDAHIDPLDIIDLDVCDLRGAAKTLREISAFLRACIEHYRLPPGRWLRVHTWHSTADNRPDPA